MGLDLNIIQLLFNQNISRTTLKTNYEKTINIANGKKVHLEKAFPFFFFFLILRILNYEA